MTPEDFRKTALGCRYQLLRSLSYFGRQSGQGPATTAYELTQIAIRCGFVSDRKPVSGAVLDGWIRDKNPPAWAVKAAVVMLFDVSSYTPNYEEMAAMALVLGELFPDDSAEDLKGHLPESLQDLDWPPVLAWACDARKRRLADQ
ncbi:MAG: hypothetical protein GY938_11345 [Ketobacter sp.]|nr:hypothetical protein [Ketobacter sp.]